MTAKQRRTPPTEDLEPFDDPARAATPTEVEQVRAEVADLRAQLATLRAAVDEHAALLTRRLERHRRRIDHPRLYPSSSEEPQT